MAMFQQINSKKKCITNKEYNNKIHPNPKLIEIISNTLSTQLHTDCSHYCNNPYNHNL